MFSSRTGWRLKPNRLSAGLAELRQKKIPVLDLTESNPTRCGFAPPPECWLKPLSDPKNLLYEPSARGLLPARESVARYYAEKGVSLSPESVFLTASTSESYSFLLRILVNPGENILVPKPSYPLFDFLADVNDAELRPYSLRYDGVWTIDLHELEKAADQKTRAIILVTPNNPTGSFLKKPELERLNSLAKKNGIALIADEVFSDYALSCGPDRAGTLAGNEKTLSFTLSGISKILALPQMKLGWIIASGPEDPVREATARLEVLTDTFLSVNTPVQNALPFWLAKREKAQAQIRARTGKNFSFLKQQLQGAHPAELLNLEGGWYATLRLPKTQGEEEWCLEFLEKDRVYVHPGYFFDFHDEAYIVLSLLPEPPVFKKAVSLVLDRISKT